MFFGYEWGKQMSEEEREERKGVIKEGSMGKRREGGRKNKRIKEIRKKGTARQEDGKKKNKEGKKAVKSSCFYLSEISLLEDLSTFNPNGQMKSALLFLIL